MRGMADLDNEVRDFLSGLEFFGVKLGLEQPRELFRRCGNPHEGLKFIHVAGTNGKGSVCALLSGGLTAAGFRTGFYSSPHLVSARERLRFNGRAIPEDEFNGLIRSLIPVVDSMKADGFKPTYFEVMTVAAAKWFCERKCEFVVWETGMGGRLDATNIVTPTLTVITGISVDHEQYLGEDETAIAVEKAGIIKQGVPLCLGVLPPSADSVISDRAREMNAPITRIGRDCKIEDESDLLPRDGISCFRQAFLVNGHHIEIMLGGIHQ